MRKRLLLAVLAVPLAVGTALASPASAATGSPRPPHALTAGARPADFTNIGSITANVKIQGWDGNCITFAHPVIGSVVAMAPCNGGHNWDWVASSDGLQVVMEAHGTNFAIGDSGGQLQLRPYNQTSDSFVSPQNTQFTKNGVFYQGYAFSETNPNFVYMKVGADNATLTPSTAFTIHCVYRFFQV